MLGVVRRLCARVRDVSLNRELSKCNNTECTYLDVKPLSDVHRCLRADVQLLRADLQQADSVEWLGLLLYAVLNVAAE